MDLPACSIAAISIPCAMSCRTIRMLKPSVSSWLMLTISRSTMILYGHYKGDELLRRVALCLDETVTPVSLRHAYGGDEFICLCVNTEKEEIESYLKRVYEDLSWLISSMPHPLQLLLPPYLSDIPCLIMMKALIWKLPSRWRIRTLSGKKQRKKPTQLLLIDYVRNDRCLYGGFLQYKIQYLLYNSVYIL